MFVRSINSCTRIGAMVLLLLLLPIGSSARNSRPSEKKFERDLQSLLGAAVATKHGEMAVRQKIDAQGRVRKQIIVGPGFSEIQIDENGDGTIDFWEVTRGHKSVAASHPNRGRFLRLEVSERFSEGLQESTYLLNLDGRAYTQIETRFTGNDVRRQVRGESTSESTGDSAFEAVDDLVPIVPQKIASTSVPTVDAVEDRNERIALEEAEMLARQGEVLGDDLLCAATDSDLGRLAAIQRDWWKILKHEVDEKEDLLAEKIKSSKMFDKSCKTEKNSKDLDAVAKAIATVMMSSSKGDSPPETSVSNDNRRGLFLSCLEASGLGKTVARIESNFLSSLNDPFRTDAPIRCSWKLGPSAVAIPLEAGKTTKQITVYATLADIDKGLNAFGTVNNYQNTIFHEFIHVGGLENEKLAEAAQSCCGDPTGDRLAACSALDKLVAEQKRFSDLTTHLARTDGVATALPGLLESLLNQAKVSSEIGSVIANELNKKFLLGLDDYKKGKPPFGTFEFGLISNEEFSNCVDTKSDTTCRAVWTQNIRQYIDQFFGKECRETVQGAQRKLCKQISTKFKDELAKNITASMIYTPPLGVDGACPVRNVGRLSPRSDAPSVVAEIFAYIFGGLAGAEDPIKCPSEIGVPPPFSLPDYSTPPSAVDVPSPMRVTPGTSDITDVGGVSNRPDRSVGDSKRPPILDRSPLPVTRVDSKRRSRSFVEDRYRRATEFVGKSSEGMSSLRDAFLPRATAGERTGRRTTRLSPSEEFIAFKPERIEQIKVKLDNPFSANRSIASILAAAPPKVSPSSTVLTSGSVAAGGSGAATAKNQDKSSGADKPEPSSSSNSTAGKSAKKSVSVRGTGPHSVAMAGGLANGKIKASSKHPGDILDGMFTMNYRQVHQRLKRVEVVEALIEGKISIQDAQGRIVGSRKARDRYVFVGFDQPLRRLTKKLEKE